MKPINITGTHQIPEITLDKKNSKFEFSGPSLPEDAIEFYAPIHRWINNYIENPNETTNVVLK